MNLPSIVFVVGFAVAIWSPLIEEIVSDWHRDAKKDWDIEKLTKWHRLAGHYVPMAGVIVFAIGMVWWLITLFG